MKDNYSSVELYKAIRREVYSELEESDSGYAFFLHEDDEDRKGLTFFIDCVDTGKCEYIGFSELR